MFDTDLYKITAETFFSVGPQKLAKLHQMAKGFEKQNPKNSFYLRFLS
jgi:Holliday junction resolvase-like predicted endonuclease